MSNIVIITARGGSKRVPRKNIKEFCGKPILVYSIEAALESGVFDEVMVSTEDEEIAQIARAAGAKVPFLRSAKTADDFATSADVIEEVLTEYAKMGQNFEYACILYPTAPFVTGAKLKEAMGMLQKEKVDSVLPMVQFSFPPQRALVMEDGKIRFANPEHAKTRSQDLQPMYHDCGQFCCFTTKLFLTKRTLVTDNTLGVIYPESEVQDIDTLEDWKLAELKYRMMKERSHGVSN
ncbi:MAG: pseudaminic acid cytidylyltransferase [Lachnospiraceae bacterium]|nr:pseudaminic acid cytidylyltransferase [Lachnospiraceae bacterium]